MHRRQLIKNLGIIPVIYPLTRTGIFSELNDQAETTGIMEQLMKMNDAAITLMLEKQEKRKESTHFGGVPDAYGIYNVHTTTSLISAVSCGYAMKGSSYYRREELPVALENAAGYILSRQYADGTIDLYTTNFHSTPDTAFMVEPLTAVYTIMERQGFNSALFRDRLLSFLKKAGEALRVGGIHTPNHRWVVSMALARLHSIFPEQSYIYRIDQWLAEKIDIDPDGQYAERSAMIYTPLVNRCLITMARLLDRPELFEPVRKNLEMSLYYMHPNGEVVTESSKRQDQYQRGTFQAYYYPYRYMAVHDRNRMFSAMTQYMERSYPAELQSWLLYLLEDPQLRASLPEPAELPSEYIKTFTHSGLVRLRHGKNDATIISGNPAFFTFYKGNAVLQGVRLASAFFGKGQFTGDRIEKEGEYYVMSTSMEGPYYQPYPAELLPGDGDWDKMPRTNRPQSEVQKISYEVRIAEKDNGYELAFDIKGTDNVPVALELAFRKGGILKGVRKVENTEDAYLLEDGNGEYTLGNDTITFGPGHAEHSWTVLRGALPKSDALSVYLTGFTPFKRTLIIS